jgi:hypothetical protein
VPGQPCILTLICGPNGLISLFSQPTFKKKKTKNSSKEQICTVWNINRCYCLEKIPLLYEGGNYGLDKFCYSRTPMPLHAADVHGKSP